MRQRKYGRTPGEVAFDRCFLPLFISALFAGVIQSVAVLLRTKTKSPWEAAPSWSAWGWSTVTFIVGIAFAILWIRGIRSLISVWRDPSAKVLRFSSTGVLLFSAPMIYSLLAASFD